MTEHDLESIATTLRLRLMQRDGIARAKIIAALKLAQALAWREAGDVCLSMTTSHPEISACEIDNFYCYRAEELEKAQI